MTTFSTVFSVMAVIFFVIFYKWITVHLEFIRVFFIFTVLLYSGLLQKVFFNHPETSVFAGPDSYVEILTTLTSSGLTVWKGTSTSSPGNIRNVLRTVSYHKWWTGQLGKPLSWIDKKHRVRWRMWKLMEALVALTKTSEEGV